MKTIRQINTYCRLTRRILALAALAYAADGEGAAKEKELIEKLRSDSPAAEKAIACKHLAVYGSRDAVPELARLLPDERLASWSRIALEAIPGPEADEALRKAIGSLKGRLLVGTINSIGVRRDQKAVEPLHAQLQDADADVASAAAVALGHIGNAAATKALRGSLAAAPAKVRNAVAEGCILCAERLMQEGRTAEAVEIYDEVRKAEVPKQKILEATRGAILARKSDGIPLLVEQLRSADRGLFRIGLSTAREMPGREVGDALAAELAGASPDRAALLLVALADRHDGGIPSAVLEVAKSGPKQVRLAAIGVIGRLGDASSLPTLLDIATDSDEELSQAAKAALAALPGDKVDADVVARLASAEGKTLPILIELVGQRRIDATDALVRALENSDAATRSAALTALGATVKPEKLSVLVSQAVSPQNQDDAKVAQKALRAACVRMPDREACAAQLAAAMPQAPVAARPRLPGNPGRDGWSESLGDDRRRGPGERSGITRHRQPGAWRMDDGRCRAGFARPRKDRSGRQVPGSRAARLHPARSAIHHPRPAARRNVPESAERFESCRRTAIGAARAPALPKS